MKTTYDIELLTELEKPIQNGIVKEITDTNQFLTEIEKNYPFSFSGIDWGQIETKLYLNLFNYDLNKKKDLINRFFSDILNRLPNLTTEKVIIIGDGLTSIGFEMYFEHFIQNMHIFFNIPQHTYIWFPYSKKCINLTFEDELFFG